MVSTKALDTTPLNAGNKRLLFAWLVAVVFFAIWLLCLYSWVGTAREHIVAATLMTALFVAVALVMVRVVMVMFVIGSVALALVHSKPQAAPEGTQAP